MNDVGVYVGIQPKMSATSANVVKETGVFTADLPTSDGSTQTMQKVNAVGGVGEIAAVVSVLPDLDQLPVDILLSTRCVVWNYHPRDNGKPTKVPYQPHRPGLRAAVDDATTWSDFSTAYDAVADGKADGCGIVLGDGAIGVDLDQCRDPKTGEIAAAALTLVRALNSYTEISPSGTGLHVLVRGQLPPGGRRKNNVEMYADLRYFTVTGQHLEGTPREIFDRTRELAAIHAEIFRSERPATTSVRHSAPATDLDDATLLTLAANAKNGAVFSALWRGDVSRYDGDKSAADLALCNCLAFWTGRNADRMDQLFRLSGLMRLKWDSRRKDSTYGADTIGRAIADCQSVYESSIDIEIDDEASPAPPLTEATKMRIAWPVLADTAYVGALGTVVRTISPFTEADPVALLAHLAVGFGNLTGRSAHVLVGATPHHANENVLITGDTSVGRKGTAWDDSLGMLTDVDRDWAGSRVMGGLSSGEGLIAEVRDPSQDGEDPGVPDKRLLVVETEFSKVLRVCRREGNILSTVLRQAWDSGTLRTLTRGQPLRASGAHISIVGHCTPRELRKELRAVEMGNGFANRFLLVLVRRSQLLPDGGRIRDGDRKQLVRLLEDAVALARTRTEMTRTADAQDHWRQIYADLTGAHDGLVGSLCNRATAHVIRLSLIYALADGSPVITFAHQQAAHALWQFSEASCNYVFGHCVGDRLADYLLTLIRDAERTGLTQTEISAALGRHRKKDEIHEALQTLVDYGVITSTQEIGKGRAATRWYPSEYAKDAK